MYKWRKLTKEQQTELLKIRAQLRRPLHYPPHFNSDGESRYHLAGSIYEHKPIIGASHNRMLEFSSLLVECFEENAVEIFAWCVLPNHWHALVQIDNLKLLTKQIGRLHGRISFKWNKEENLRGRQCWNGCSDRRIRSKAHFYATCNYIHNNPVKHGYAEKWTDWDFSSASSFIDEFGKAKCIEIWKKYPVLDMGDKWDSVL